MFDYIADGQMSFFDYFKKPALNIKPKSLVEFINGMGPAQYTQIKNVISETAKRENYNLSDEAIGRLTNSVSVWLLGVGTEYGKYLNKLIEGGAIEKGEVVMTNGDRIRSMTDQDLAGIIMCPYGSDGLNCIDNERGLSCIDCSLDWIKAECVDEESERLYE